MLDSGNTVDDFKIGDRVEFIRSSPEYIVKDINDSVVRVTQPRKRGADTGFWVRPNLLISLEPESIVDLLMEIL